MKYMGLMFDCYEGVSWDYIDMIGGVPIKQYYTKKHKLQNLGQCTLQTHTSKMLNHDT